MKLEIIIHFYDVSFHSHDHFLSVNSSLLPIMYSAVSQEPAVFERRIILPRSERAWLESMLVLSNLRFRQDQEHLPTHSLTFLFTLASPILTYELCEEVWMNLLDIEVVHPCLSSRFFLGLG